MIATLHGMLAMIVATAIDLTSVCSLLQISSHRPRNVVELSLRATTDSVPDLRPVATNAQLTGHRARLPWDTATVYGQVFRVIQVDGGGSAARLRDHAQVVVVWWRLGMQCQRVSPKPAVRLDVDDLFMPARPTIADVTDDALPIVADLRPDSQWIRGMPTLDVTAGSWMYSPNERRPVTIPPPVVQGALTIPEYREFFAILPAYGASYEQMLRSWRRLLSWAAADPRRWSLYPAASILCVAQVNTGTRSSTEPCPS